MSYIFEALQRAEAERAGGKAPEPPDSVADLLQEIEREVERRHAAEAALVLEASGAALADAAQAAPSHGSQPGSAPTNGHGQAAPVLPPAPAPVSAPASQGRSAAENPPTETLRPANFDPVVSRPTPQAVPPPAPPQAVAIAVPVAPPAPAAVVATSVAAPLVAAGANEVVSFAGAQVLAPNLRKDSRLVCLTEQGSLPAEKFRVLGLKLRHLRDRRKLKRLVITSSIPGEGKSLVSSNLALNQARSKILKTVLIDGDMRRPELGSRFGIPRSQPGLAEFLSGQCQLSEVVYKLQGTGLWFVPAGVPPENPIELMQSGRLIQMVERLESFFDWVIIDTPPVRPLADTPLWMRMADGVLLVTREGVCEKNQLDRVIAAIDRATILGVVVNSCSSNDHKYYYSRYGPSAVHEAAASQNHGEG